MNDSTIVAPLCSIFRRFLKARGLKYTSERSSILDAVLGKDGLFQAEQLLFEMRRDGHRVSKATIYRTLKHLVEAGIIQQVLLDSKQAHYQLIYGKRPTDHLVNVEDDKVIEFHSPEIVKLRDKICREHDLEPVGHRFLIYAVPAKSAKSSKPARSTRKKS
ncbi:MAG: transcriptional repressor [Phycisphaeraceae bacterium]|nr:transcriptional repressor [Phycisphaeraceae bacterium]